MSLLETTVAMSILAVLMFFLAEALRYTQGLFRSSVGNADASLGLRKLATRLRFDLLKIQPTAVQCCPGLATMTAAPDSDALWMLSNSDPVSGVPVYRADGTPFWQRTVLYYAVTPLNHAGLFGYTCPGGAGPDGRDDRCPHKVMIRKLIDFGPVTTMSDESTAEALMTPAQAAVYFTRPNGYNTAALKLEPGVHQVELLSPLLLGFQAQVGVKDVTVNLRAVTLPRARRSIAVGATSLYDSPYTFHFGMTVEPQAH